VDTNGDWNFVGPYGCRRGAVTEPNANHVVNRSRSAFGAAVALLVGIFAFAIPLTERS
jgi:hypothetical protein